MNLHEYLVRQNKAKLKESKTNTDHCDLCHEAVDNGDDYYTSYGSHLCEECWDEYLKTEKGAVELFITLARDGNKESLSKYSAEELDKAVASWKKNKNKLATADDLDELETRAKAMGLLKEGTKLTEDIDDDDDDYDDYDDEYTDDIDSILDTFTSEDFLATCEAGELTTKDGHSIPLDGTDAAWMTGYAWMDLYEKINIKDEIKSTSFKAYLGRKKIKLTDSMSVDDFTNIVFKYLSSKVNNGKVGYKFYDGENHGLLCKVGNKIIVIYVSLHDDPYLADLDIPGFKAYVDYGIQKEFKGFSGLGMYTNEKVTNTDTVTGLIDKLINSWGVEED